MRRLGLALALACLALAALPGGAAAATGPCTDSARGSMPEGAGHDHRDVAQHRFACRMRQVAYLPLKNVKLPDGQDVVLGEMDVKNDLAVVLVTYPEAGFLLFDVSNPARPTFLSWYRSEPCNTDGGPNCGSFVDISADGKTVFLSKQDDEPVPNSPIRVVLGLPLPSPSIEVVDVSNPRSPTRRQTYNVDSDAGVHTVRSHVIPEGPEGDGREPGEYVFSVANFVGVDIARVDGSGRLEQVATLNTELTGLTFALHDTFIQNDPLTDRTYLYLAAGLFPGFVVFDVTDPSAPSDPLAEWDLTPNCNFDWYSHTIDVTHRGSRRYVTLPAEIFDGGEPQPEGDQEEGCGEKFGNPDKPGPLWIVETTRNFGNLADLSPDSPTADYNDELESKSRQALVTTWTNPAGRAGGDLLFSPHNQQIVGDEIYLSHYHGGVYRLDASAAFSGRKEAPTELGVVVPHETDNRPLFRGGQDPFVEGRGRPDIWDAFFYKGHVLAADMVGGFYSFRPTGGPGRPRLGLRLRYRRGRLGRRRCARSGVRATVVGRDRRQVRRVDFLAGRRRVARDRRAPFRAGIKRRRLRRGKRNLIRARVLMMDGRRTTLRRRVLVCR